MIDVKIIKKPKATTTNGVSGAITRQTEQADKALHAVLADNAVYADKAGRAETSKNASNADHAAEATHAESAYDIDNDSPAYGRFLRKDAADTASGKIVFAAGLETGTFVEGSSGAAVKTDGSSEVKSLKARQKVETPLVEATTKVQSPLIKGTTKVNTPLVEATTKVNTPLVEATTKVQTPLAEATEVVTTSVKTSDFNPNPLVGVGFGIYKDTQLNNATKAVVDYLSVRKGMKVAVLEIAEYKSVNGGLVLSPANGVIESVDFDSSKNEWMCYLKREGDTATNPFAVHDLVRCQTWDMDLEQAQPLRYYWLEVTNKGIADNKAWIVLAKPANFADSEPQADDVIVQMGNTTTATRQGFAVIVDDGISVFSGVTSTDLSGKLKAKFGNLNNVTFNGNTLSGYGLFGDNVFLKGSFMLQSNKTVETAISEGDTAAVSEAEGYAKNYTDGRETTIRQDFVAADGVLSSTISKVSKAQQGNINLARLTNQGTTGWSQWNSSGVSVTISAYQTDYVRFQRNVSQPMTGSQMIFTLQFPYIKSIPNGQKLTLSFDIDYDDSNTATQLTGTFKTRENGSYTTAWTTGRKNISYSNDGWQHFEFTAVTSRAITSPNGGQIGFTFHGETTDVKIRNIKLELGEAATIYSAAPEDTEDEFAEVRSEISQTAEQIALSVVQNVVNGDNPSLYVPSSTTANFYLASNNRYFNPLSAFALDDYLNDGYYTFIMLANLGTAWESFSLAVEDYHVKTFALNGEEKGSMQSIERSFQFTVPSDIRHQAVYVRLNLPSGMTYDASDPTMSAELSGVWLYSGDAIKGSLKRTGIDILTGKIILQADNVLVKNSGGTTTTMIDANGKLETNIIKADELDTSHLVARDSQNQIVATVNASLTDNNGTITAAKDNSGAYRIYYPGTAQTKLELKDEIRNEDEPDESVTTMRMFDTNGNILWELGTDALTNGFTNPNIVMLDLSDTSDPEVIGDLPSQRYAFHTNTNVIEGGVTGQTYYSKGYEAEKNPTGYIAGTTKYIRKQYTDTNSGGVWTIGDYVWYVGPLPSVQRTS